jgi:hypothetical protein
MLPLVALGEQGRDGDGGDDWPDQAGVLGRPETDPPDRARAADFAEDGSQGDPGGVDRVSLRSPGSAAASAGRVCRAARQLAGGQQQAAGTRAADGAAIVRVAARRGLPGRLRQRAASRTRLAPGPITAGRSVHSAVVRAGRRLSVRLVARGGGAGRGDDHGQARPHPALPQPDVPGAGLSARDPGDGVRRARPRLPPVWRGMPARDL